MWGNYKTFLKDFNDEQHMNNWVNLMIRKGHKIIGVQRQYMSIRDGKPRKQMQLEHNQAKARRIRKYNI